MGILHSNWLMMFMIVCWFQLVMNRGLTSHPKIDHVQNFVTELPYFLQHPCACKFNPCDFH